MVPYQPHFRYNEVPQKIEASPKIIFAVQKSKNSEGEPLKIDGREYPNCFLLRDVILQLLKFRKPKPMQSKLRRKRKANILKVNFSQLDGSSSLSPLSLIRIFHIMKHKV